MRIEEGEITIPENLYSDYVIVRAYGGPRYLEGGESEQTFTGLDELIDAVVTLPSYSRLTVELFAVDPYSPYSDALYGVEEITFDYPGYVLYDEREEIAMLMGPEEPTDALENGDKDQAAPDW